MYHQGSKGMSRINWLEHSESRQKSACTKPAVGQKGVCFPASWELVLSSRWGAPHSGEQTGGCSDSKFCPSSKSLARFLVGETECTFVSTQQNSRALSEEAYGAQGHLWASYPTEQVTHFRAVPSGMSPGQGSLCYTNPKKKKKSDQNSVKASLFLGF